MKQLKLLDLFCGAGGAAMGYHQAGFEVVGVDNRPQPNYPFRFIRGDAFEVAPQIGHEFDLITASPPCQFASILTPESHRHLHANLIPQTRKLLQDLGKTYIIENVEGAREHLNNPLKLCGSMFGLTIWRHRYFENNFGLFFSPASCRHDYSPVAVSGRPYKFINGKRISERLIEEKRQAMGIDWMNHDEITLAIPPAYTEWLGQKAIKHLQGAVA
jgi:DNA (cytosine-5)-methyltransferase 1